MTEEQMKKRLYNLYVFDQMESRGYTIEDVFQAMSKHGDLHSHHMKVNENGDMQVDIRAVFEDWVCGCDYHDLPGLLLFSFDVFCQATFDPHYIQMLLDKVPEEKEFRDACNKWLDTKRQ